MKVAIILGTRPEIIKMASVIRACQKSKTDFLIIHTNQHYSENMDKIFFDELELPQPAYNLGIGSGLHGEMTGKMLIAIEEVLIKEQPTHVFVQGDTNTVLAGALVASKMGIKVGHIEAGLRSYDRTMPEELNRIMTDHISDYLFAPTKKQAEILESEAIEKDKIHVVGNTVVDAVFEALDIAKRKSEILRTLGVATDDYLLLTSHRPATVDNKANLVAVLLSVVEIAKQYQKDVIFPAHPRTVKMIDSFGLEVDKALRIIEPVGYLDMLTLQQNAFLIATDSGGIQEEACILQKKALVLRENTERPEAVDVGGCVLVGNSDPKSIVKLANELLARDVKWYNPFGDGTAAKQIIGISKAG